MLQRWQVCLCLTVLSMGVWCNHGNAQYMFLDANGDGVNTSQDGLATRGDRAVDLWLVTDESRTGRKVPGGELDAPLSIISYEVALKAVGGTVKWGSFTNHLSTMEASFGRYESPEEFYVGFAGRSALPPGRYRLATLEVRALTGEPQLEFLSASSVYPPGFTSFGSSRRGVDSDYTLKFGKSTDAMMAKPQGTYDWADADGLGSASTIQLSAPTPSGVSKLSRFGVELVNNGSSSGEVQLRVTMVHSGPLMARLFDVQGRLVETLIREGVVPAGTRLYALSQLGTRGKALPSGIYFYKVTSVDGVASGRVVVIR